MTGPGTTVLAICKTSFLLTTEILPRHLGGTGATCPLSTRLRAAERTERLTTRPKAGLVAHTLSRVTDGESVPEVRTRP